MSFFSNQKTWFFIALFFIIVNVVLIVGFFSHKHGRNRNFDPNSYRDEKNMHGRSDRGMRRNGPPFLHANFIADTLGFSPEQRKQLADIEKELNTVKDSVFEQNENCKQIFNSELYSQNPKKEKLDSLALCISSATEKFNKVRIDKVFRIRTLCNPDQLRKFSEILSVLSERRFHGERKEN